MPDNHCRSYSNLPIENILHICYVVEVCQLNPVPTQIYWSWSRLYPPSIKKVMPALNAGTKYAGNPLINVDYLVDYLPCHPQWKAARLLNDNDWIGILVVLLLNLNIIVFLWSTDDRTRGVHVWDCAGWNRWRRAIPIGQFSPCLQSAQSLEIIRRLDP